MRNQIEVYVNVADIVDTLVTTNVTYSMDYMLNNSLDKESLTVSMHQILIYLESHAKLLSKKLIFFTEHEIERH